jgi:hypothetical protein
MSARKPRRPARQRYDSSRDRDTAAMVFLSRSPPRGRRRRQFRCRRGVTRPRGAGNARCARIDRRLRPRGDSGETRAFPARARAPPAARTLSPRSRSRPRARSRRVSQRFGFFTRVIRKKRLFRRDLFRDASLPARLEARRFGGGVCRRSMDVLHHIRR